jgi:hypothetical protein
MVRLSREADAENLSKDGMIADCRAVADREGLDVIAVHVDDGISGAVRNRPAFLAWLADVREGRADTLISWHADRMTREGVNVAAMILDVVEGKDDVTGKVIRPAVRLLDTKGLDSQGDEDPHRSPSVPRPASTASSSLTEQERFGPENPGGGPPPRPPHGHRWAWRLGLCTGIEVTGSEGRPVHLEARENSGCDAR